MCVQNLTLSACLGFAPMGVDVRLPGDEDPAGLITRTILQS